jgi:hypothetical protein
MRRLKSVAAAAASRSSRTPRRWRDATASAQDRAGLAGALLLPGEEPRAMGDAGALVDRRRTTRTGAACEHGQREKYRHARRDTRRGWTRSRRSSFCTAAASRALERRHRALAGLYGAARRGRRSAPAACRTGSVPAWHLTSSDTDPGARQLPARARRSRQGRHYPSLHTLERARASATHPARSRRGGALGRRSLLLPRNERFGRERVSSTIASFFAEP